MFWYQTFDSLDILISNFKVILILRKFKPWENWHGRGIRFNEPVQVQRVERFNTKSDGETTIKKKTYLSYVITHSGKVGKGGEH